MKITSIKYKDTFEDWELERVNLDNIALLVGVSGAGKSLCLSTILNLRDVLLVGETLNGVEWSIEFNIRDIKFQWSGEFDKISNDFLVFSSLNEKFKEKNNNITLPKIKWEKLYRNEQLIVERNDSNVKILEKISPKISPHTSAIKVFSEEELILPIIQEFENINAFNLRLEMGAYSGAEALHSCEKESITLETLRSARLPALVKLAIVSKCYPDVFNNIKEQFMHIFPQIKDIRYIKMKDEEGNEIVSLQIKEKDTNWIPQNKLSTGMIRTLIHISQFELCADGSIFVIDEFENSLGVNCIDIVSDLLINNSQRLQFILSSHHPYIINQISIKHWHIIQRKGSKIYSKSADEMGIGKSKHEAFKQLINSIQYFEDLQ